MIALPQRVAIIASRHISGFGIDDFICIGLIALLLVIATFVVRGGEKDHEVKPLQAESKGSAKE